MTIRPVRWVAIGAVAIAIARPRRLVNNLLQQRQHAVETLPETEPPANDPR